FLVSGRAALVRAFLRGDALLVVGKDLLLVGRDDDVVLRDRATRLRRVVEAEALDLVEHVRYRLRAVAVDELPDEGVDLPLRERAVEELVVELLVLPDDLLERALDLRVEDHAAGRRQDDLV